MTDIRVTNTIIEVFADWGPPARVSNVYLEVLADWDPFLRVSNVYLEVFADWNPLLRVSNVYVEVFADWDPLVRVTQYHLEVIRGSAIFAAMGPLVKRRPSWIEKGWRPKDRYMPHAMRVQGQTPPGPNPVVPETGGDHWWLDMETGGFFQLEYASDGHDPQSIAAHPPLEDEDQSDVILGCADGYARQLDRSVFQDDGLPFTSKAMLGPYLVGPSSMVEGLVEDIEGVLTRDSGQVDWELRVHREWENAAKEATTPFATGTWTTSSVNPHVRPRARGTVFSLLVSNAEDNDGWSIEEIIIQTSTRGRRRARTLVQNVIVLPVGVPVVNDDGVTIITQPGQTIEPEPGQDLIDEDGNPVTTEDGDIIIVPPATPIPPPPSPSVATITPNDGTVDNAQAFEDLIELYSASGSDFGIVPLPAGTIRFETTPVINHEVGTVIQGQGSTDATSGPRTWGGWTGFLNGTSLYADPTVSGSGAVIEVQNCRNLIMRNFDIHLAESDSSNYRLVGIHFTNPDQPSRGPGEHTLSHISICKPIGATIDSGTIGIKFGTLTADANIDTTRLDNCQFKGLETCMQVEHNQGMAWRIWGASIHACSTFANFNSGGNFSLTNWDWADTQPNNPITLVRTSSGVTGVTISQYVVRDGYIDRQSTDQTVTIFDFKDSPGVVRGVCEGVNFRNLDGTPDFTSNGAPYFDLGNQNTVVAISGNLGEQPIVRWNSTTQEGFRASCTVIGANISSIASKSIARDMVTSTGGYNGHLTLIECRSQTTASNSENVTATVGIYPVAGNSHTHWDWQGTEASVATYDGITGLQTFANSWLKATHDPLGHWKFDDVLDSTTAVDSTANGNDLSLETGQQVAGAPVPWLERSCNCAERTSNDGADSGISITPASTSLLITGFARIGTSTSGSPIAAVGTGTRYIFGRLVGLGGVLHAGPNSDLEQVAVIPHLMGWFWFCFYANHSTDVLKTYIDGRLVDTRASAGWSGTAGSGNVYIGGDSTIRWEGSLSRVSVITPGSTLDDEDIDKIFRSATYFREQRGLRPVS